MRLSPNVAMVVIFPDRPWLMDGQKVQKLQEQVYLALQHSLLKSASEEKLDKVKGGPPRRFMSKC